MIVAICIKLRQVKDFVLLLSISKIIEENMKQLSWALGNRQPRTLISERRKIIETITVITQAFYNFWITEQGGGDSARLAHLVSL